MNVSPLDVLGPVFHFLDEVNLVTISILTELMLWILPDWLGSAFRHIRQSSHM